MPLCLAASRLSINSTTTKKQEEEDTKDTYTSETKTLDEEEPQEDTSPHPKNRPNNQSTNRRVSYKQSHNQLTNRRDGQLYPLQPFFSSITLILFSSRPLTGVTRKPARPIFRVLGTITSHLAPYLAMGLTRHQVPSITVYFGHSEKWPEMGPVFA